MTELRCACIVSRCLVSHKETVNESIHYVVRLNISHAMSNLTTNKQQQHTMRKHPHTSLHFFLALASRHVCLSCYTCHE
eukprot:COSAG01_NODE_1613_length_9731_cov_11.760590_4_plen_79_part_00